MDDKVYNQPKNYVISIGFTVLKKFEMLILHIGIWFQMLLIC